MSGFGDTLKAKVGPLPTYVWALIFVAVMVYLIKRRKAAAAASPEAQSAAAAGQVNSDLGSASELANIFTVAGLMPYQGGATYVNTTQDSSNATTTPPKSTAEVYNTKGKDLGPALNLTGSKQVAWVASHIGQYGYTKQESTDINNAYAALVKQYGAPAAENYALSWHAKGNVTATNLAKPSASFKVKI